MKKNPRILLSFLITLFPLAFYSQTWGLDTPFVTAMGKGPNQINLTWSGVANPGWGYKVEIQSNGDSRCSSYTELPITKNGRTYLPYWVTESHYKDVIDGSGSSTGSPAQFQMYGLIYNTTYNFRVRCYGKNNAGVDTYGSYSNVATAITTTPSTIRYVTVSGAGTKDGTSWANAWEGIRSAKGVSAGTLVLIKGGDYASDEIYPSNSGSENNKIVYQANPGDTVTITSRYTISAGAITLSTNYVIADGVNVTCPIAEASVFLQGNRNAVVNLEVDARNKNQAAVFIGTTGQYNLIHYCYLHDVGVASDQGNGSLLTIYGTGVSYNVVEYSHLRRGAHDTGLVGYGASYNQFKNNLHDGGWGIGWNAVGNPGSSYHLFEGNVVKDVGTLLSVNAPKPGIMIGGEYNTARRNLIYDGKSVAGQYCSAGIEVTSTTIGAPVPSHHNLIYNNTVVNNGRQGLYFFDGGHNGTMNNTVANNIFYANTNIEPYVSAGNPIQIAMFDTYTGNRIANNLILGVVGGMDSPKALANVRSWNPDVKNTADANTDWAEWKVNITTSPNFIDFAGREFHLKSSSGLRNAGIQITDNTWGTITYSGTAPDIGAFEDWGDSALAAPSGLRIIR